VRLAGAPDSRRAQARFYLQMERIGLFILNRQDRQDRKEKRLVYSTGEQLDRVREREEVACPIVDSAVANRYSNWKVARIKDGIQHLIWRER
jgi:hypothetical protein